MHQAGDQGSLMSDQETLPAVQPDWHMANRVDSRLAPNDLISAPGRAVREWRQLIP